MRATRAEVVITVALGLLLGSALWLVLGRPTL